MFPALQLNRRHRAALFATLIAAGAFLLSGESVKSALGVVLLGVAFAWAFGSNDRFVHILFLACGGLIIVVTLTYDWNSHRERGRRYQEEVASFERRIPELASDHPLLPSPLPAVSSDNAPGTITVPLSELNRTHEPVEQQQDTEGKKLRSIVADPDFTSLSTLQIKRKVLSELMNDPDIGSLSDKAFREFLSEYAPRISNQGFIPDPTQNYSPPVGLRLTRDQLLQAIKNREPAYNGTNGKIAIDDFLNMYPDWRAALVDHESLRDPQAKWYTDAIEAGVNVTELSDEVKPGSPPEPFRLSQSASENWLLILPGLFLFLTGTGLLLGVRSARHES